MPKIAVYFAVNGAVTVRMPKGAMPDRDTLERLSKLIREHRKNPTPCGNIEQGSPEGQTQEQNTSSAVKSQEGDDEMNEPNFHETHELWVQLTEDEQREVIEYTRKLKQGRA